MHTMRIVVLGGYGNFGARICRALAACAGAEVIAAGRNPEAGSRAAQLDAEIGRVRIDIDAGDFPAELAVLAPDIVVHCAGPFQGQDYRVAQAAIAAGAHYIDLADGRDFVANFAQRMHQPARAAGVLAVAGASTLPALSSAVIDSVAKRLAQIDEIRIVIAPARQAARGAATLAAVFSYAGRSFKWLCRGVWVDARGWQGLRRVSIAGVGARWAAACDVPDLALLPARYPGVATVEFRAALPLAMQQAALWIAASLRRHGMSLPLERWGRKLARPATPTALFGAGRGGMLISVTGSREDGSRALIEWHLTAQGDEGPEIPCMAAVLLAGKLVRGELATRGAFPCMGFLTLAEFEAEFKRRQITALVRERGA